RSRCPHHDRGYRCGATPPRVRRRSAGWRQPRPPGMRAERQQPSGERRQARAFFDLTPHPHGLRPFVPSAYNRTLIVTKLRLEPASEHASAMRTFVTRSAAALAAAAKPWMHRRIDRFVLIHSVLARLALYE